MVGQQCIKYSVNLISTHFAFVVSKVCECLLHQGPLSWMEITRIIKLPKRHVRCCLCVLIQHSCVQAFRVPKIVGVGGKPKSITLYTVILDNIIHQMRLSKFLLIVEDHLDSQHAELLELFLQHGKLTFESLYYRASTLSEGKAKRDDVLAKFNNLVHGQYVERCPKTEPFLEPNSEDEVSAVRKRIKSGEQIRTIEQEAIIAATLSDADRFSGILSLTVNAEADMKAVNNDPSVQTSTGTKRKREDLETDEVFQNIINMNEVLWRVNYEKFVQCLKKKASVDGIRSRLGLDAALVLEAMIELSDHQSVAINFATSSINNIIECVKTKPGGISLSLDFVREILERLGCQLCQEDSGTLYTIGLKGIIETCQNDEVDSLVKNKYGKEALRIFKLLINKGRLIPMDQISDETFLEKKEAQRLLCVLWKDDYVEMERVNMSGARSEMYLWKVNKKILWEDILDQIFHAALNLCLMISQAVDDCKALHADVQKLTKLKEKRRALECSLLKLDAPILLFHNF